MEHDVCKFIPKKEYNESIQTVHFVYETNVRTKEYKSNLYHMMIVADGKGVLRTRTHNVDITKGDVFFLFPNCSYTIEAQSDNFRYMYISYMGIRAGEAMHRLGISSSNFLFCGYEHLISSWKTAIYLDTGVSEFSSEGVLLLTFAAIGNGLSGEPDSKTRAQKTAINIKNYIDDNFSDQELSLEKISSELFYNRKYISHVFKSEMKIGFSDYVNTVRLQHACELMKKGAGGIKDIAEMCGFRDALYFSKIFKQKMSQTPTDYIKKINAN